MQANTPVIWFKSYPEPQASFAGSLWIAIHTQVYNYTHINNYIIRVNKIKNIISYMEYLGTIMESNTLERIASAVNRNMKKLKNPEFKLLVSEDNDSQRAVNYMEKGRLLVLGVPYSDVQKFTGYDIINTGIPKNITYYLVIAKQGDYIYTIPGMEGIELKTELQSLYSEHSSVMVKMQITEFIKYCEINRKNIRIIYASVITKTGEEVRSLNEY